MERKVNFPNQGFDIAVTQSSITAQPDEELQLTQSMSPDHH